MSNKNTLFLGALLFLALLLLAYSNHFDNGFYFDDSHTILKNGHIREISNIPKFFTDASTFSSLPANQAYRPMVTTLNAVDYWIAGGLRPVYFHVSIFFWYVVQLVLMFFLFRGILDRSAEHPFNPYIALCATAFYGLHTVNAETINYIISRSDSFSTLCIVATLVLYRNPRTRRLQLHLLAMIAGIYTKQTGVMAAPLLFLYVLFFEERATWRGALSPGPGGSLRNAVLKTAPAFVIATSLFLVNQFHFTPETTVSSNTSVTRGDYLTTQTYIVTHYLGNFLVPLDLSADPDFEIIGSVADPRVLFGLSVNLVLLALAAMTFGKMRTRAICFGILWFYLTLAPTSSLVPLYQIANDHRTFAPYVGLVLALAGGAGWVLSRFERRIRAGVAWRIVLAAVVALVVGLHAFGTYQRNEVWGSSESLWLDVTIKSPGNGRGLMNYGLTQMEKGNYAAALEYYERALVIVPRYSYLHVNMAILKDAMQAEPREVEAFYRSALQYGPNNPAAYYYYAGWLKRQERLEEARRLLEQGIRISPGHTGIRQMLGSFGETIDERIARLAQEARDEPTPDVLLDLSLAYYQAGSYDRSIEAARSVLAIRPDNAYAYNNICSAHCKLEEWDEAISACRKALEIDPEFHLARNNLEWAINARGS